jgi:hypothetical protein
VKNAPFGHFRVQEFGFYFQDNFRVNNRFTINAGLRWEMHPAPHTEDGLIPTFDLAHNALMHPNPVQFYVDKGYTTQAIITNMQNLGVKFETPQQAGFPSAGIFNNMANFNPRCGFAYTPFSSKWGAVIPAAMANASIRSASAILSGFRSRRIRCRTDCRTIFREPPDRSRRAQQLPTS